MAVGRDVTTLFWVPQPVRTTSRAEQHIWSAFGPRDGTKRRVTARGIARRISIQYKGFSAYRR